MSFVGTINAQVEYDPKQPIKVRGGSKNNRVFKGYFMGHIPIAVKVYTTNDKQKIEARQNDFEFLYSPKNKHPNLVLYYGHVLLKNDDPDRDQHLFATELCVCSVADIIEPLRKVDVPNVDAILGDLSKEEILRQSSEAVNFLHEKLKMAHRNLHPDNFLVSCVDPKRDHFVIKLTDFQRSKDLGVDVSDITSTNANSHPDWIAPEDSLPDLRKESNWLVKRDAFILGCFYYYVFSGGKHPFGSKRTDETFGRVLAKNDGFYSDEKWDEGGLLKEEDGKAVWELIRQVTKFDPSNRKLVKDLLEDPFFSKDKEKKNNFGLYESPLPDSKPGLCVIISQGKYHNPDVLADCGYYDVNENGTIRNRGVLLDAHKLGETFAGLGFDILFFKNLRAQQMETVLSPDFLSQKMNSLSKYASLVVGLLGHGDKSVVYGVDGEKVLLNKLQYAFNDESCPALKEKPKIFIILACQGENEQKIKGMEPPTSARQTWTMKLPMGSSQPLIGEFLTLSATIEEFVALFDHDGGSDFINFLCASLHSEYYNADATTKKRDLIQLFSYEVIPKIMRHSSWRVENGNRHTHTVKQTPELRSMLTKKILFEWVNSRPDEAIPVYDGENNDQLFKIGQTIAALRSTYSGTENRKETWYKWLLYTIYFEAKDESEVCQRAVAWTIRNKAHKNSVANLEAEIEKVCSERSCWKSSPLENLYKGKNWKEDLEEIGRWLPNVFKELGGYDFSMGSTDFNVDSINNFFYVTTVKIGNIQFYKDATAP